MKRKFLNSAMALLCAVSIMPGQYVLAANPTSQSSTLKLTISDGYTVSIPESITLTKDDSGDAKSTATIGVKGNLTENKTLSVSIPSLINLSDTVASSFKQDIEADVDLSKTKTSWQSSELDMLNYSNTTFDVGTSDVSAGTFKGVINFAFTLKEVPKFNITYNLNGGTYEEGEINPIIYSNLDDNFILNNPSKEAYYFTGWAGTNLASVTPKVTVNTESNKNLDYSANYLTAGCYDVSENVLATSEDFFNYLEAYDLPRVDIDAPGVPCFEINDLADLLNNTKTCVFDYVDPTTNFGAIYILGGNAITETDTLETLYLCNSATGGFAGLFRISANAINNNPKLKTINIENETDLETGAIKNNPNLTSITYNGVTYTSKTAFNNVLGVQAWQ